MPKCEDGWIGNTFLDHCYRVYTHDYVQYADAVSRCRIQGAELVPAMSGLDEVFLKTIYEFYISSDECSILDLHDCDLSRVCTIENGFCKKIGKKNVNR